MCLEQIYSLERMSKYLEDKPDVLTVYKVVRAKVSQWWFIKRLRYWPIYFDDKPYKTGLNTTIAGKSFMDYAPYFHFFATKADAEHFQSLCYCSRGSTISVIECQVQKRDIETVGVNDCYVEDITLVAKRAIFPAPVKVQRQEGDMLDSIPNP